MHLSGLLGILVLVGLVAGCDGAGHDTSYTEPVATQTLSSGAVNVEQIDSGQYGDIVGTRRVLRDSSAYADFWAALHADRDPLPERPSVDFATEVVVAVVMGERPTGGYTVTVDDALADPQGGGIQVRFTETMPGDECEVTQAMTSPYVLATVAAQSEDIMFAGSEETRTC